MNLASEVGRVIRIEWDEESDNLQLVLEINDPSFKKKILQGGEYQDLISLSGTKVKVMKVASRRKNDASI